MNFNPYLYEKLIATRHAQIRYDIQQSRKLVHTRQRRTLVQSTVSKLGTLLIKLGSQMQRTGQRRETSLHTS
jgi:hypothetical protein